MDHDRLLVSTADCAASRSGASSTGRRRPPPSPASHSRPCGRRRPAPRPIPSAAPPVPPSAGPLAATPGATRRRWESSASNLLPQSSEPAQGIGLGIVDHARPYPGGQVGHVLLFDRRQRAVEEKRVDVGPHVLVAERNSTWLGRVVQGGEEDVPLVLQEPQKLLPAGDECRPAATSQTWRLSSDSPAGSPLRKSGRRTLRECRDSSTFSRSTGVLMSFGTMLKQCISTNSLVSRSVNCSPSCFWYDSSTASRYVRSSPAITG